MIRIYARVRARFERGQWDWRALGLTAYALDDAYVPDLENDADFAVLGLEDHILGSVGLTNLRVGDTGWCVADPIVFTDMVLDRPCSQTVLVGNDDGAMVLHINYPTLLANPLPHTFSILSAQRGPGWFRL